MPPATRIQHVARTARYTSTAKAPPKAPIQPYRSASRSVRSTGAIEQQPAAKYAPPPVFSRSRALPWVLSSMIAGSIGFYMTRLFIEARRPCQNPGVGDISQQKDVSGRYEDTADTFDSEVGLSEALMGVNRLRKKLARKCKGHVLEASCGTGRNLGYFDVGNGGEVESLTFVDLSPHMVEVCKKKWVALMGEKNEKLRPGLQVRFLTGSVIESMPSAPTKAKYDTIIQTMGLCSTPSPTDLLTNLVKHLDTTNPEARILLLEHGRSYRMWLNRILDNSAEKHAEIHGCWFNRDIGALVGEAAHKTGLDIVSERRHHFGTTWIFELKPSVELASHKYPTAELPLPPEQPQPSDWRSWVGLS
ncbi:hypothetical protein LTR37_010060 [Vermiconidia calcicola]|uniref:Uncharacterized protein n=1 Tax=Vermiconidia calcicola TaxID=1690605 RepID=A0ACC3N8Y3_9PEZI|nr:hypothetical protein LTR37_010060 [Vermiconidia calcicola]